MKYMFSFYILIF